MDDMKFPMDDRTKAFLNQVSDDNIQRDLLAGMIDRCWPVFGAEMIDVTGQQRVSIWDTLVN